MMLQLHRIRLGFGIILDYENDHCEERSDEAILLVRFKNLINQIFNCFASIQGVFYLVFC